MQQGNNAKGRHLEHESFEPSPSGRLPPLDASQATRERRQVSQLENCVRFGTGCRGIFCASLGYQIERKEDIDIGSEGTVKCIGKQRCAAPLFHPLLQPHNLCKTLDQRPHICLTHIP